MSEPNAAPIASALKAENAQRVSSLDDATVVQTELPLGTELAPGFRVGSQVITELAARGGFSVVYRATGPLGEPIAVKVLHAALLSNKAILDRFDQEVEVIQTLDSPYIARIRERGELSDGRPFVAMEWLSGKTLDEVLKQRGSLRLTTALSIALQLASALSVAHAARIIHRDIKGSNVMLLPDGEGYHVKLLDFGIAKRIDCELNLTRTGAQVGTPSYMAPEQIVGRRISPATDIYALGVLMFEMLTGGLPFKGESAAELELLHLDALPPRASDAGLVPEAISDVIQRCMAKSPAYRYSSVDELVEDLREAWGNSESQGVCFGTRNADAVGILITWTDDSVSDDVVVSALSVARATCDEEGFMKAWEGHHSFLVAATLPSHAEASKDLRIRAIRLALTLTRRASQEGSISARICTGRLVMLFVQRMPQIVGGPLLDTVNESTAPGATVLATDDVLVGIEERFAIEPGPPVDEPRVIIREYTAP